MIAAFIHGIALSFGLILPLGVQNVFIFNQGAVHKRFFGAVPAILTAGICDTLLILLAVTGVSLVVFRFEWIANLIFIIGFFFLIYIGWSIFRSEPNQEGKEHDHVHVPMKRQITFAASVSLLNPHAILDTIGVIGSNSLTYKGDELVVFTASCICVSWMWFFGLAIAGRMLGKVDSTGKWIKRLNQVSAFIIWGIALYFGMKVING